MKSTGQPSKYWNFGWVLIMIVIVSIVQIPLSFMSRGTLGQRGLWAGGYLLGFVVAIGVGGWIFSRVHPGHWQRLTRQDWQLMVKGYLFMIIAEMALNVVNISFFNETSTKNNALIAEIMGHSTLTLVMLSLTAVLASPILEELTFRGILVGGCFPDKTFWLPVITSGVVFSLVHQSDNLISWLIYAIMGGTFAYIYRKTDKLQTTIILHGFNNLIAVGAMIATLH
ncbi:CPBP family intramembrane glutamic endopeptidase [Levilactobacillus sp. HBUAS70063]|uniref:CPBP family intramembrane glutamic endopeptidase n=1 Tax=Levilactobacillus sp. HBUAS70063 TaxID=3109359 RepID=UPI0031333C06